MKRVFVALLVIALPIFTMAQGDVIEKLISKYSGQSGVTVVNIGPDLFQMVSAMGIEEIEDQDFPLDKVSSIKVLTIEDEEGFEGVNFYNEIKDDLDVSDYKEIISVNDGDEIVRMWMKMNGEKISDFLLIVSGDDNTLVYITGDFNMKDLEEVAGSVDGDIKLEL